MADIEKLYDALRKADAAGNAGDAKKLADAIRQMDQKRSPKQMSASDDPNNVGLMNAMQSLDEGATKAGGWVTDKLAGKVPPQVAGTAGMLTKMLPDIATLPLSALGGAKAVGVPLAKLATGEAKSLMQSALKPTVPQLMKGEGKVAVDTMLEKNLTVSNESVLKLRGELADLQGQVSAAIERTGGKVPKSEVIKTINEAAAQFKGGTGEVADLQAIRDVVKEFNKAPSVKNMLEIPAKVAQRMKTLEYRRLDRAYGELGDAEETARKGLARGLKEGIEKVAPEVKSLNAEEQKIYRTLPILERRAMLSLNKDKAGIAMLAHNPKAAAAMMLDRSSLFKSWLANRINQFGNSMVPQGIGGAGGVTLHEIGKDRNVLPFYGL